MCGYVGAFNPHKVPDLTKALNRIEHRGPDSSAEWSDHFAFLGHNRLKIIDLSDNANQPMHYKHLHLIFNGEIYNYKILRAQYQREGYVFRTRTDTEVLLAGFMLYGENILSQLEGMFSFVIYNELDKSVFAARDRIGEKPLYYVLENDSFIASSEIAPIFSLFPDRKFPLDKDGLSAFLLHGYNVPPPYTAYVDIKKLEPGYKILWSLANGVKKEPYWHPEVSTFSGNLDDAVDVLDQLLNNSIQQALEADIPITSMLSGGIDSSLVTAIANKYHKQIHTYSLGMGPEDPELLRARKISQQLKTTQSIVYYTTKEMEHGLDSFEKLQTIYSEPFNVFTAVYANHLYKKIGEETRVCLTGNGADEIFAGYYGYANYIKRLQRIRFFRPLFQWGAPMLSNIWREGSMFLHDATLKNMQDTLINLALYGPMRHLKSPRAPIDAPVGIKEFLDERIGGFSQDGPLMQKLFIDLIYSHHHGTVMMADILPMQYSLELRSPYLNQNIINFAYSLPTNFLIDQKTGQTKVVLKKLAERYMPKDLIYIKKLGFGYSIDWTQQIKGKWNSKVINKIKTGAIQDFFGNTIEVDTGSSAQELLQLYSLALFLEKH